MDSEEVFIYLIRMEEMGLVRKLYDPESKDFLWELTPLGLEAKRTLNEM